MEEIEEIYRKNDVVDEFHLSLVRGFSKQYRRDYKQSGDFSFRIKKSYI